MSDALIAVPEAQLHTATPGIRSAHVLDVFYINSGWNTAITRAVEENLPLLSNFLKDHRLYVLKREQAQSYMLRHPVVVGADPVLLVVDRESAKITPDRGYGFRLCLGHVRQPEAAVSMMKWAVQVALTANGAEMCGIVRQSAHRESFEGTIELLGEGTGHLLEFAPVV